jgi:hypothetical protein
MVAESAKRRTLSKADVATAVERRDMFDFLIDIVPRGEASPFVARTSATKATSGGADPSTKRSKKGEKGKGRETETEANKAQDEVATATLDQEQSGSVSAEVRTLSCYHNRAQINPV